MADFAVVNGVYGRFVSVPPPARSTVEVAALPKGGRIEIEAIARPVERRFAAREYTSALKSLAVLRKAVDDFFDSVMVMADDATLRGNRLALLRRLQGLFMHAADLSRLPG
jgi:hypothetical protein